MGCYHPIPARQGRPGNPVVLWAPIGTADLWLDCQKCIGCRAKRADQWAQRCVHEASHWDSNIFVTLTYADEKLPKSGHLLPRDFTLFVKRFRKEQRKRIRYFGCGEYGEDTGRPHYHLALFNTRLPDGTYYSTRDGNDIYNSDALERIWGKGRTEYGQFTADAAAYIAQYQLKKQRYDPAFDTPDEDGVLKQKPFLRFSKGLGKDWLEKYHTDLRQGYIYQDGFKTGIPRYYRERLKKHHANDYDRATYAQHQHRHENPGDRRDPERLKAQEYIHTQKKAFTEKRELS